MEKRETIIKMPGYHNSEYLLIISPNRVLEEKIQRLKKDIFLQGDPDFLLNKRPVIRLAQFFCIEMLEERLIRRLREIAMGFAPFTIQLGNYESFPSHTILIPALSKNPIKELVKEFKKAKPLIKSNIQTPHFYDDFYIPLMMKLPSGRYEQIWNKLKSRQFSGKFLTDAVLLLRKESGSSRYSIAARLDLSYAPITAIQGSLFR